MKVLVVNKFLTHVGGVETYVRWLAEELKAAGDEVSFLGMAPAAGEQPMSSLEDRFVVTKHRDFKSSGRRRVIDALNSVYSWEAGSQMQRALKLFRPDVVHFHMTCRQLTPSVGAAVERAGVPSVTTVHEYKPVCASQRLWDDNRQQICDFCIDQSTLQRQKEILSRRCVKGSAGASALAALEIPIADKIWNDTRTVYHAPSRFMKSVLDRAPYIGNRVDYLDLPWEEVCAPSDTTRSDITYIGRIAPEKGIRTLLKAWAIVEQEVDGINLNVAGGGDDLPQVMSEARALGLERVRFSGRYEAEQLTEILSTSLATVHPSEWFENSPFAVRESLVRGVPAIVTDIGGLPEMVDDATGSVVPPRSAEKMALAIVDEVRRRRAGTSNLLSAVQRRRMGGAEHLTRLRAMYEKAEAAW